MPDNAPSQPETFDLCVLGSGAVGQLVAYAARKHDKSVVMIETREPGGTCPNRGCDAKKPFVNAAHAAHATRRLAAVNAGVQPAKMNWAEVVRFKRTHTDPVGPKTAEDLRDKGVDLIELTTDTPPSFLDRDTLRAGDRTIAANAFVVATGRRARTLDFEGGDLAPDSDQFLELDDLPERVCFIGGGYVGMEFACAAAVAGRHVTVVASGDHVLGPFDTDVVKILEAELPHLGEHGVTVLAGKKAGKITRHGEAFTVYDDDGNELVTADLVVNASGRPPSLDGLNLEAAGVEAGKQGVKVDRHLRNPGNPKVWAGGDCADTGQPPLIPTAVNDGRLLKHNLFVDRDADLQPLNDGPVASIAFTLPPVASVGLTEQQAREQFGDDIDVHTGDLSGKKYFRQLGQQHAGYKLVFGPNDELVGAHLAGESADEVINLFAIAISEKCSADQLGNATLTYPSVSAAVQNAFRKASDRL